MATKRARWVQVTVFVGAVGCAIALGASTARADPPAQSEIVAALSGFEHGPDAATVLAWGDAGVLALMSIATDANQTVAVRARAVYALRSFGNVERIHTFVRQYAATAGVPLLCQRAAFDALAQGFGDVVEVQRYLRASDPMVRDGAAWALGRIAQGSSAARAALESALRSESHPTVRATLQSALAPRATQ